MNESEMPDPGDLQSGELPVQAKPVVRPGAQLGAQRQAQGWTIEQVANQLNLAPRQILALEEDNYAALPGIVIARGFVRAYAKLLKIDPTPLVAMMADAPAAPAESIELRRALSATFSESSLPTAKRAGRTAKWIWTVLLLGALGVAGWYAQQHGGLAGLSSLMNTQMQGEQQPSSSQSPSIQDNASVDNQPEARATDGVPMGEPAMTAGAAAGEEAVAGVAPGAAENPEFSAAAGKAVNPNANLILKVREESWIEIRRADQVTLIARLVTAGSTESFEIRQPAELVVGNAAGVDVTFRGKPLDLTTAAKSNVARLNLQ